MTCPLGLSLGAYALGSLTGREREDVAAHLRDCTQCRDELAGMAGVVGLLHRLSVPSETAPDPFPPQAGAAIDSEHRAKRARWRRPKILMAAVAAVVGLAIIGVLSGPLTGLVRGDGTSTREVATSATWSARDPASGVAASASMRPQQWGTSVQLRLTHLPARLECHLVVTRMSGSGQTIGTWRSGYRGSVTVPAATAVPPADIATLEVVTTTGDRLVRLAPGSPTSAPAREKATT
jgi:anti-sigma factor RsiW